MNNQQYSSTGVSLGDNLPAGVMDALGYISAQGLTRHIQAKVPSSSVLQLMSLSPEIVRMARSINSGKHRQKSGAFMTFLGVQAFLRFSRIESTLSKYSWGDYRYHVLRWRSSKPSGLGKYTAPPAQQLGHVLDIQFRGQSIIRSDFISVGDFADLVPDVTFTNMTKSKEILRPDMWGLVMYDKRTYGQPSLILQLRPIGDDREFVAIYITTKAFIC